MGCGYFAILALNPDGTRYWLWFGVVAGIGLEEKYSIAVLGFAIVAGLLLTPHPPGFSRTKSSHGSTLDFFVFFPNFNSYILSISSLLCHISNINAICLVSVP